MNFENNGVESNPDFKYEKDKDPQRLEEISQGAETPKQISFEYEGENIQIEYIEVASKERGEGKEKVFVILPGFSASYVPYANTVKELAGYMGNYRVICLSPLDSGKSSSLKSSNLNKMNEVCNKAFLELNIDSDSSEVTVIGHSRSDIIALEMARSHPEIVKNVVLANGISANESNLLKLTYDFLKHINVDITPERIAEAFNGETEAAKNYWRQNVDFMKNFLNPTRAFNQFKSLAERRNINLEDLFSELKSNVLVMSGANELLIIRTSVKMFIRNYQMIFKKNTALELIKSMTQLMLSRKLSL
jgi:pimeloyl-ACP methyl ester carboxylesterase